MRCVGLYLHIHRIGAEDEDVGVGELAMDDATRGQCLAKAESGLDSRACTRCRGAFVLLHFIVINSPASI